MSERGEEKAKLMGELTACVLRHSTCAVANSRGWCHSATLVNCLANALSTLPPDAVQVLGLTNERTDYDEAGMIGTYWNWLYGLVPEYAKVCGWALP
eukprot:3970293-Pyramimonas_sp.AAC.1